MSSHHVIPAVCRPVILELDGVLAQSLPNSIHAIGGVVGPNFTVGGLSVILENGQPANGGPSPITLQNAYNNSPAVAGKAVIQLVDGKDLKIQNSTGANFLEIDSETGTVTVNGDFVVTGSSTIVETVINDSDHWLISPKAGTTTALSIRPDPGVTPVVDLVTIRRTFSTPPVFRIDSAGNLIATENLTVGGLINGVDLISLNSTVQTHIDGTDNRHTADQIDIAPITNIPGATNVQQALEALSYVHNPNAGNCFGYQHIQDMPAQTWIIVHGRGTLRASLTVYDSSYQQIIPEEVHIIDANTVRVSFAAPMAGSALVLMF